MAAAENLYDVVIIGGGPAGLSAAIYLTRAKYRVLVLEKEQFGGQITITHEVVNYPGVGKCSGKELTDTMYRQAEYFGAEFLIAQAESLELKEPVKTVHTNCGDFQCLGILLATGAHPRMVGFQGEEEYKGRGVAYCATCDGEFFTGKEIFVVGGGYAAAEESIFLTKFASHVTILIRKDQFSCAEAVADRAKNHEKITVLTNTEVEEVKGDSGLNYIRYKNNVTGEVTEYRAKEGDSFGVFVFAGYAPETELVKGIAALNEQGYVITDASQKTSVDGLYAAGDICIKPLRQVVTATSDGALAATELEKYVAEIQQKTGLRTKDPVIREAVLAEQDREVPKEPENSENDSWITPELRQKLEKFFTEMEQPICLKLYLDERPLSKELLQYMQELTKISDRLSAETAKDAAEEYLPCVRLYRNGLDTGLAFHGVPGGHEFGSFLMGIRNAAGAGNALDENSRRRIREIKQPVRIQILVTLSCSMCPDLVIAAQQIAAMNESVTAEIYDVSHYERLQKKYHVMSVPCMVINEAHVSFGRKTMPQLLDILEDVIK